MIAKLRQNYTIILRLVSSVFVHLYKQLLPRNSRRQKFGSHYHHIILPHINHASAIYLFLLFLRTWHVLCLELDANDSHLLLNANDSHLLLNANDSHLLLNANDSHLLLNANDSHLLVNANDSHLQKAQRAAPVRPLSVKTNFGSVAATFSRVEI